IALMNHQPWSASRLRSSRRLARSNMSRTIAARFTPTHPSEVTMRLKHLSLLASASLYGVLIQGSAQAQSITGLVSSPEEATMEGVLVSAKKDGSTITVTVVTDDKGRYTFPAGR